MLSITDYELRATNDLVESDLLLFANQTDHLHLLNF